MGEYHQLGEGTWSLEDFITPSWETINILQIQMDGTGRQSRSRAVWSLVINFKTISNEKKVCGAESGSANQMQARRSCGAARFLPRWATTWCSILTCITSSYNMSLRKQFSSTVFQIHGQEMGDCLKVAFVKALRKLFEANHIWHFSNDPHVLQLPVRLQGGLPGH